jgi:hypothetical protein
MGNSKYRFLKQWFTFTYDKDNTVDMFYSCTNNHYVHRWLEEHGCSEFDNIISKELLDSFIYALNESSNMVPDDFDKYFPEHFIENCTLWDMDNVKYWNSVREYREHIKKEMVKLLENLFYFQEIFKDGYTGVLKYNIYYSH